MNCAPFAPGETGSVAKTEEGKRLDQAADRQQNWQRWGTYLSERQWGTVREDYSPDGNPWTAFTHDMARYRTYRWGEDGLLGYTDRECRLCFSTSLWNGADPILKERLFGLTNPEGNHGEDCKELYYYLDATPTASYAKALYKYPQRAFPYEDLLKTNAARTRNDPEYELLDTGIFDENRYFDVQVEYAKHAVEDILIRITASNRGPDAADLCLLPTLTLRNNWSWRNLEPGEETRPSMQVSEHDRETVVADHRTLGRFRFYSITDGPDELLFTENDTNFARLDPTAPHRDGFTKDAFDRYLVQGEQGAVNPERKGTKSALLYRLHLQPGASRTLCLRLVREDEAEPEPLAPDRFDQVFAERIREADAFYADRIPAELCEAERAVSRQSYAGLLWTKQFYYFVGERWLAGDPAQPPPPPGRKAEMYSHWRHLFCRDILSVPDKWEYPWFAAWDTAFHMVPMAQIDPNYAKTQLLILLREWYLHPNGQMPAFESDFSAVNPPVHAWAVVHVYDIDGRLNGGKKDTAFLERCFQKLLMNFTWWVNRNDESGRNLFGGGFLGLDNIGIFDRSMKLPEGVTLNQADGTAWMGLFCAAMLTIAIELAQTLPVYEDIAGKFFEHYTSIIDAMNHDGGSGLWDEDEGFYFDQLTKPGEPTKVLKIHSVVGIIPLYSIAFLRKSEIDRMPEFRKRMDWFLRSRPDLRQYVPKAATHDPEMAGSEFIALVPRDRLERILSRVLRETEFLSPYGLRALSRIHAEEPFSIDLGGKTMSVQYLPGESNSGLFGGNSNWRGPVWFPVNALLVNALERYHAVYGDELKVECPSGSGNRVNLLKVAEELATRLSSLFLPDANGRRPSHGDNPRYEHDPDWCSLVLFSEYFCGDTGRGLGASHQTGWTGLASTFLANKHRLEHLSDRSRISQ